MKVLARSRASRHHSPHARLQSALLALVLATGLLTGWPASAQAAETLVDELPPGLQVPAAALPGPDFDVERATQAYLDLLNPEQKARSDAYFEGGYWLELWQVIYALVIAALLLFSGWSRRMRELAQRISHRPWLYTALYGAFWTGAMFVLDLPWLTYVGFFREKSYGLATQTYGAWFGERALELGIELLFFPILLALLYAAARRTGDRWWLWAGAITGAFLVSMAMVWPVYLAPLFNDYTSLEEGPLREQVLSLARANGIPADDVYVFDASRQTTRISANVSGIFGTTRIALNDNLLDRTSPPEIRAVMAHEMGHYVLDHAQRLVIYMTLVLIIGFWVVHRCLDAALARWGRRWGVSDRTDPAGLPAVMAVLALFFLVATPITNSIIRQAEAQADAFGLDAAREPHGFASTAMRLSTYRKIHPSPLEEMVFYDHPSGYSRVHRSMTWLAENLDDPHVLASLAEAGFEVGPAAEPAPGPSTESEGGPQTATGAPDEEAGSAPE